MRLKMTLTRSLVILFSLAFLSSFSQARLTKDSFFVANSGLPKNYKALVEDTNGWKVSGRFNCYTDKIDKAGFSWDTLHKYTSFERGSMYCRIKDNKILAKGDLLAVLKIIYVDPHTLILENKQVRKIKGKNKLVKIRTRYRRVT